MPKLKITRTQFHNNINEPNLNPIIGEIIIPFGAIPQQHELEVAELLIQTGHNVKFLKATNICTADILYINKIWEIKSPTGRSGRTIENNLRNALRQSNNIILDLHRTIIPEEKCINYLTNHFANFRTLKELLLITKFNKIYKFVTKNSCLIKTTLLK